MEDSIRVLQVGQFERGELVSAVVGRVAGVSTQYGCVKVPQFDTDASCPLYTREISTSQHVTTSPTLPDPYEQRMVEVRTSRVPGAQVTNSFFSFKCVVGIMFNEKTFSS